MSGGVVVPIVVRDKHPELVELIMRSESMNDAERQYWVDILPAMDTEQIEQLRTILVNERDQLAAIDAKYADQIEAIAEQRRPIKEMEATIREKAEERQQKEEAARAEEEDSAEEILKKIEGS